MHVSESTRDGKPVYFLVHDGERVAEVYEKKNAEIICAALVAVMMLGAARAA